MTLGLFQAVMGRDQLKPADLNLPRGDGNMNGPQLWERTASGLKVRKNWMRVQTQLFQLVQDFAPSLANGWQGLRQQDADPNDQMPMQNVPPEAALMIAQSLGCRLPTSGEWEVAVGKQIMNAEMLPNLRDAAWAAQMKYITELQEGGTIQAQWPDAGMFPYEGKFGAKKAAIPWTAAWHDQQKLNVPVGFNDKFVFLRPVGNGAGLSDLIGNVSEMVFDAPAKLAKVETTVPKLREVLEASQDQLFVVGGSCISQPEVGFAKQPCGMHGGFSDTGFRIAFEAANRLIVDRLKELMSEQQYVAVSGGSGN